LLDRTFLGTDFCGFVFVGVLVCDDFELFFEFDFATGGRGAGPVDGVGLVVETGVVDETGLVDVTELVVGPIASTVFAFAGLVVDVEAVGLGSMVRCAEVLAASLRFAEQLPSPRTVARPILRGRRPLEHESIGLARSVSVFG
jgi:hypothetical protein